MHLELPPSKVSEKHQYDAQTSQEVDPRLARSGPRALVAVIQHLRHPGGPALQLSAERYQLDPKLGGCWAVGCGRRVDTTRQEGRRKIA
jgi:hypothetical protein